MKNSCLALIIFILICSSLRAENLLIESKNITIDKKNEISIFKDDVLVITAEKNEIKSDYAEYNRKKGFIKFKNNIVAKDSSNNIIKTNSAEYNEIEKIFISNGQTIITTSENYEIIAEDIIFNDKQKIISSKKKAIIKDRDNNEIYLENFEYQINENIFKSVGFIEIKDIKGNSTEFSQIYIDTKKKEILGTDIKSFINQEDFKINKKNKPRIFSNSVQINEKISTFNKSVFTLCDYREKDKCPPWVLQSNEMKHDREKKTIFYNNVVIKVYDIPIFYTPYLSHPDPSVDRRSGFLTPNFTDTKNLGAGLSIPYYFAIDKDKDFTITNKFYASENPLFLGEYRQAFQNSNLILDFGYTEGYKKTTEKKKSGEKHHFFTQFTKNFKSSKNSDSFFNLKLEDVSNDKYLELYKIKTDLVDFNKDILESSMSFTHEKGNRFLRINSSVYESLKDDYNDKYEYILPEITYDSNIFSNDKFGNLDLQSNFKVHNYDTNKTTKFLVNDFDWDIKDINFSSGIKGKIFSKLKNVNYETKNVSKYREDPTSELYGAFGYLTEVDLFKRSSDQSFQKITPKVLLRYAPGKMKKEDNGAKLNPINVFNLNRLNNTNQMETGLSATLGFDYELNKFDKKFNLSVGQVINEKENKDLPSSSSLDEKLSDLVGSSTLSVNNNFNINYNFAVDQNYNDLNYNEIGASFNLDLFKFNLDYLQEKKHVGNNEYVKAEINIGNDESGMLSLKTKRNLITSSSEYYDLSYEYINDCLRAGLVYRREFYEDSELETENSLMFKITLIPFGDIDTPSINK